MNTGTELRSPSGILADRRDGTFHHALGLVSTDAYEALKAAETAQAERERVRLLYVACTRAEDLLVLPRNAAIRMPWLDLVALAREHLPTLDTSRLSPAAPRASATPRNDQNRTAFTSEARRVAAACRHIEWRQPSRHERPEEEVAVEAAALGVLAREAEPPPPIQGGPVRGTLLHKLLEEILSGETSDERAALVARAAALAQQLGVETAASAAAGISAGELADTVRRTLALPEVAALRPHLQPELTVRSALASDSGKDEVLVSGVADAVALDARGHIAAVIDWKSDVSPGAAERDRYRRQVRAYMDATGAPRGLLVYLTSGHVDTIGAR